MRDMTHSYVRLEASIHVWHDSFICATWIVHTCVAWFIHMCDMNHSYVWHELFICVPWLIHTWDVTRTYALHDPFTRVTWLIHMCAMTHSYVWRDLFICVTRLIHMCDMAHQKVCHDAFMRVALDAFTFVTWLMYVCIEDAVDVTACHGIYTQESCNTYEWCMAHVSMIHVTSHIWMSHGTHMNESCHTCEWMIYGTFFNDSWHINQWFMAHSCIVHGTCIIDLFEIYK